MKTLQLFTVLASLFSISLLAVLFWAKCPLETQYQRTLRHLKHQYSIHTEAAVFQSHPEFYGIRQALDHLNIREAHVLQLTQHPIPPDAHQSRRIQKEMKSIQHLQQRFLLRLKQIEQLARSQCAKQQRPEAHLPRVL